LLRGTGSFWWPLLSKGADSISSPSLGVMSYLKECLSEVRNLTVIDMQKRGPTLKGGWRGWKEQNLPYSFSDSCFLWFTSHSFLPPQIHIKDPRH
jgi:hypothetical protein